MTKFSINWKNNKNPFVIIIFGPTAVGKTQVIQALQGYNLEIINADSMQVYKYMDVGTAKPSAAVRANPRHHLIDEADPAYQFNAGDFVKRAEELIPEIYKRNNLPVICGGTAYYIRCFIYGLPASPRVNPAVRERLKKQYMNADNHTLLAELTHVDPQSAARINPNDRYRILRALEVVLTMGKPLSLYAVPDTPRTDYRMLLIGLFREKQELAMRINERVERMFERGLPAEIKELTARGYTETDPGMRGIGYREFYRMQKNCATLAQVKEEIKRNSRKYAKRQMTFFKSLPGVQWIPAVDFKEIERCIGEFLRGE
jgi:tRNA dimethylallyltransferase